MVSAKHNPHVGLCAALARGLPVKPSLPFSWDLPQPVVADHKGNREEPEINSSGFTKETNIGHPPGLDAKPNSGRAAVGGLAWLSASPKDSAQILHHAGFFELKSWQPLQAEMMNSPSEKIHHGGSCLLVGWRG